MEELKYGEKEIKEFDVERDLEIWPNKNRRDYIIRITLPEFCCLCPRSGYPDFATIYLEYTPDEWVVELKAIKIYINSFMNRNISHEDSINEIYTVLEEKLKPKYMKIVADFNPRGNVHTVIEIDSNFSVKDSSKGESLSKDMIIDAIKEEFKAQKEIEKLEKESRRKEFDDRKSFKEKRNFSDKKSFNDRKSDKKDDKNRNIDKRSYTKKEPLFKLNSSDKKATLVKKDDKS